MGWDGTGMNCYGMGWDGTEKYVPWTSLMIPTVIFSTGSKHSKLKILIAGPQKMQITQKVLPFQI